MEENCGNDMIFLVHCKKKNKSLNKNTAFHCSLFYSRLIFSKRGHGSISRLWKVKTMMIFTLGIRVLFLIVN